MRLTKGSAYIRAVDAALRALADPTRRRILELVRSDELAAGEIAQHFDTSRPAVSQHLRVLVDAGLLEQRRQSTRLLYRARAEGLDEVRQYLDGFWSFGLQRLKRAVEHDTGRRSHP